MPQQMPTHLESTATLLARVRDGDRQARDQLVRRYLPSLLRWGHRRLPSHARDLADTEDLIQTTLLKALDHVDTFEPRREGAFLAYLRTILLNEVRGEIRRAKRRRGHERLTEDLEDPAPSPVEQAIGRAAVQAYEAALDGLSAEEREGVILRIELGFSHREVADALGKPSADAARMLVARAMVRLAEAMNV
jgi:RNA polymerase sigma-70 factor (ECF subfamily)